MNIRATPNRAAVKLLHVVISLKLHGVFFNTKPGTLLALAVTECLCKFHYKSVELGRKT